MVCFLSSVDSIVATSSNYLASSKVLNRFKDKTVVIPIGLDRLTYPAPPDDRLEHWKKTLGNKFFLFIGVLRYYKGLHILIEAAQNTDLSIVIVGAGPIEQKLKEHARRLGLHNITFLGHLPESDKIALLQLCYAIVFPSHLRSEAFGISLLEGAIFGKPMISSEIGTGTTYVNIDNETGLVVPPSDSTALRQAMLYLWEHPKESADMGRKAELRYKKLFTTDLMAKRYVALYRKLAENAKRRIECS